MGTNQNTHYLTAEEAAARLDRTPRYITHLCQNNRLDGVFRDGKAWKIPEDSLNRLSVPRRNRKKAGRKPDSVLLPAIGSTFLEAVSFNYYVDKTLMIRDLVNDHLTSVLFTRPHRFGKSMLLGMLQAFFEKPVPGDDSACFDPHQLDVPGCFKDKQIWKYTDICRQHQGKYPVISLSFKDTRFGTWDETLEAVTLLLKDELLRHGELLSATQDALYDEVFVKGLLSESLSEVQCSRALRTLCGMLSRHHRARVIVLVDDFDIPIQNAYAKGFAAQAVSFFSHFFSAALTGNPSLAFSVMMGTFGGAMTEIGGLTVNTILDERYSEYFGFTEKEVQDMISYYGLQDRMDVIKSWYGGYIFGVREMFNPWSVACCLARKGKEKAYWSGAGESRIIGEMLENRNPVILEQLLLLLQGDPLRVLLNMDGIVPGPTDGIYNIFSFLLSAGYISPSADDAPAETEYGTFTELTLHNLEVRRICNMEILSWVRSYVGNRAVEYLETTALGGHGVRLQNAVRDYARACIKNLEGNAEIFRPCMLLGLAAVLSTRYALQTGPDLGDNSFDLQLLPRPVFLSGLTKKGMPSFPGIILEIKEADPSEVSKLTRLAADSREQISLKHYDEDMRNQGVLNVVKYGIAYTGRNVEVVGA